MLERWFRLRQHNTNLRTEIVAGLSTWMTMAYITVVNPQILSEAGVPFEGALFATCLATIVATLLMGLWARHPIAMAPGMGLNAYFAYTVVPFIAGKASGPAAAEAWRIALGAVFISGVLFLIMNMLRLRVWVLESIPPGLVSATAAGIGLFILLVGMQKAGLVVAHPNTLLTLGDVHGPEAILALIGTLAAAGLMARGHRSALLWSIVGLTLFGWVAGLAPGPERWLSLPHPGATWMAMDPGGALRLGLLDVIFVFFFVDLFDSVGTLVGVGRQGGLLDASGHLPRVGRALSADAVGTLVGAASGTSTVVAYVESAAGVAAGGRTGLVSVVVAGGFLASLFVSPVIQAIPVFATAPALILIGCLMACSLRDIQWGDVGEAVPAFLTMAGMAFTYSIADGIALGFVSYVGVRLIAGRWREISPAAYVLAALFLFRYSMVD